MHDVQIKQTDENRAEPDPNRWKALGVCLVAGFMTLLDVSIVNVALPSIDTGLGASDSALEWIVSGYALALGLLLVPAGRLGDARGRRTVFMVGVALFVLASAGCGAAPTPGVLVGFRVVQGFAGGLITPQVSGFIQTLFEGEERAKAFGFFGTMVGISTAIGPLLGGALIAIFGTHDGWRAVFFVNLPVGALALVLARRYLPAPEPRTAGEGRTELDPVGVLLLGLAVICVLVPFIEQRTWHSPLRPALFPLAAVIAALWVLHERRYARTREPAFSLDLFAIRSYVLGAGIGTLYFAGFTAIFFILTQYLQTGLGYSALEAGLAATPFAVGGALTSSLGSRQVLRRGRKLIAFGLVTVIVGLAGVWVAVNADPGHAVGWYTALPLLLAGLGGGFVISPNQTLTLSEVPKRRAGSAGGMLQTGQRIGSSAGIAVTGSIFYSAIAEGHGDFASAFRQGLVVIGAFVAAALALALADALTGNGGSAGSPAAEAPQASERPVGAKAQ
jgi:EmrB/QacA subfamily drug resistance transporter